MSAQNYSNHTRLVPAFHMVLFPIIFLSLIGSVVNLCHSMGNHDRLYSASLLVAAEVSFVLLFFCCRIFALKAQDRAIKAEENLRHYVLTGKLLDSRLTVKQIVGLRFAPDEEFVDLARNAAEKGTTQDEIKKSIKNWRADLYRV
ncbi:MAG: hypothetical protein HYZ37_11535 [Candidatus Solibacter usitatus]|nr:hypothetical protein [Candidatus Solibacter usitatus]